MNFPPRRLARSLALAVLFGGVTGLRAQSQPEYERAPIHYSRTTADDAVARLPDRIARGELVLRGSDREILRAILAELRIPEASQLVVFSRTSLQARLIRPRHPRALYFSDSVYVGWVPGGLIEVAAIDPTLGPVFYALDPADARTAQRSFVRESSCLRCHGETFGRDIPALFARSLMTPAQGEPLLRHGSELVDDATPFEERWGGWYVTGYSGATPHRGNAFAAERDDQLVFAPEARRPEELAAFFDVAPYLAATSDVVALLVFEHQLAMHNSLTRAGHRTRRMLDYQRALQEAMHEPVTDAPVYDSVKRVFASAAEDVVDHLLFRGAAPLPDGVEGSVVFKRAFATDARRNRDGASLKDFSLRGRLFANRCSFLIYSPSFRALPAPLQQEIFRRLDAALRDESPHGRYAYLEAGEKQRILAVLRETLPDSPFAPKSSASP